MLCLVQMVIVGDAMVMRQRSGSLGRRLGVCIRDVDAIVRQNAVYLLLFSQEIGAGGKSARRARILAAAQPSAGKLFVHGGKHQQV